MQPDECPYAAGVSHDTAPSLLCSLDIPLTPAERCGLLRVVDSDTAVIDHVHFGLHKDWCFDMHCIWQHHATLQTFKNARPSMRPILPRHAAWITVAARCLPCSCSFDLYIIKREPIDRHFPKYTRSNLRRLRRLSVLLGR